MSLNSSADLPQGKEDKLVESVTVFASRYKKTMNVLVLETHEEEGVEWGISFSGYNPEPKDYFKMVDKETAFRLKDKLTELSPISGNNPVARPSNKF